VTSPPSVARDAGQESLGEILGGPRSALDATLPAAAFVVAWLLTGHSLHWAVGSSVVVGVGVTGWRVIRGGRPLAALLGLLGTLVAGLIVLRTGRAADFFLVQLVSNTASALLWTISIVARWPLLGVIVGLVLGQRTRWRGDPQLVRAYARGSWVWVAQYALRMVVLWPLWYFDQVVALGLARVLLSWPLVVVCLGVSWWVVRRSLGDHPGLRHPRVDEGGNP
jgi:Protein of unknown function (DUF3159)